MASANNFAKSLFEKYAFKEDVYQTDVAFSKNGQKMFVNGTDLNQATTIYEYNAAQAYKSLNATPVSSSFVGFRYDLSTNTGMDGVFASAKSLFDFKHGISDMTQFVLHLDNEKNNFTLPLTDSSAVRMVDNSNNAIQSSSNNTPAYKAGVLYFTHNISYGATASVDNSGLSTSGDDLSTNLVHETARAISMLSNIDAKHNNVIQQFNRIFFNNDGTKMYTLYCGKNKGLGHPGTSKGAFIRTFNLTTPFTLLSVNNNFSSGHSDDVVYDVSLTFNMNASVFNDLGTEAFLSPTTNFVHYNPDNILGLYSQLSSDTSFREIIGFHISNDGGKIFFLARRGRYNSFDVEINSNHTYFGEVTCFSLASAWNVSTASYLNKALVYGKENSSKTIDAVGVYPININFNYDGTKLHILGSEGKEEYLYTYPLKTAYTLPSDSILQNGLRTEIKMGW